MSGKRNEFPEKESHPPADRPRYAGRAAGGKDGAKGQGDRGRSAATAFWAFWVFPCKRELRFNFAIHRTGGLLQPWAVQMTCAATK
jgi:hypothetical protein